MLATVLFTDIVGSTEKMSELGDRGWRELLERHHAVVRGASSPRGRGREVDTAGDGFFAAFDGPARAVRCARAIVDGVRELGIDVRSGLHTGECELVDGKVTGIAVHTGARVAAHAGAGEVLVSQHGQGSRRRIRARVRGPRRPRAQGDSGRVAALRRGLNLGDEHPVVGRRRVCENVGSRRLAHRALKHERAARASPPSPARRARRAGRSRGDRTARISCSRASYSAAAGSKPYGPSGSCAWPWSALAISATRPGSAAIASPSRRCSSSGRSRAGETTTTVGARTNSSGISAPQSSGNSAVDGSLPPYETPRIGSDRLEERGGGRGVGLVLPHLRARDDGEVTFDVDGVRRHDDGDVGLRRRRRAVRAPPSPVAAPGRGRRRRAARCTRRRGSRQRR